MLVQCTILPPDSLPICSPPTCTQAVWKEGARRGKKRKLPLSLARLEQRSAFGGITENDTTATTTATTAPKRSKLPWRICNQHVVCTREHRKGYWTSFLRPAGTGFTERKKRSRLPHADDDDDDVAVDPVSAVEYVVDYGALRSDASVVPGRPFLASLTLVEVFARALFRGPSSRVFELSPGSISCIVATNKCNKRWMRKMVETV